MGDRSAIEWTDATWTPIRARRTVQEDGKPVERVGWHCEHKSEGCRLCYAEAMNRRLGTGLDFKPGHRKSIELFLDEEMLLKPLRWKRPRMIFVCSMTDLFADFVTDAWIDRVFAVMALAPQHVFQVLTKRPARMRDYLAGHVAPRIWRAARAFELPDKAYLAITAADRPTMTPLPNVWLGTSVEDQAAANERIPLLLQTRAAVRWLSCEPLLGPVDLSAISHPSRAGWFCPLTGKHQLQPAHADHTGPKIDWIVLGGESGPGARPMHPDWPRSVRDQCVAAGVAFLFKQWGAWAPSAEVEGHWRYQIATVLPSGRVREWADGYPESRLVHDRMWSMALVGKKKSGRYLDGREHDEYPRQETIK